MRNMFLPFARPSLGQEEIAEVVDTLRSGWITTGPKVERFAAALCFLRGRDRGLASGNPAQDHLPPRPPDLWPALATEKTYGFPSGQVTMSTLSYGAAAALVLHLSRNRALRGAALALATLIILSVSCTRIYLGAHWTSNVAGGILVGLFWVSVCATGTECLARRKPRKT